MRNFYDLVSIASSAVCVLYFVYAFLAMHARLSEIRDVARAEATLRLFVKSPRPRSLERGVTID